MSLEEISIEPPKAPVANDVTDMTMCMQMAISQGLDYFEINPKLFRYFVTDTNSKYFTYGSNGIKVILQGYVDEVKSQIESDLKRKI